MFYSHEVLTSPKYGVATVWLVATLGQQSSARKVTRKAILGVDVPKACNTIITPDVPMALRLQSSLLYGVSRVYSQQCDYVLTDAHHAQNTMRALLKAVRATELDPGASRARRDQVVLEDDPSFVPGLFLEALDSDLLNLDIAIGSQRRMSDTRSLHTPVTQHSQPIPCLDLPSSSPGDVGDFMMLGEDGNSRGPGPSSFMGRGDEGILLPEIDIGLDDEGNFIELDAHSRGTVATPGSRPSLGSNAALRSGGSDSRGVGNVPAHATLLKDDNLAWIEDDYQLSPSQAGQLVSDTNRRPDDAANLIETSSTAGAMQRRRVRIPKTIPIDRNIELRNRDLLAMNNGYLAAMQEQWRNIAAKKIVAQAKKNANYWILGRGIAGVGNPLGPSGLRGPLAAKWSGENLYYAVTGIQRPSLAQKRSSEDGDSSEPVHRVRPRLEEDDPLAPPGDNTIMQDYDLEVGREGPEPLADISSAMPWNVSASLRGSSVNRGVGSTPRALGSLIGSQTRGASRMVSASPLIGRGIGSDAGLPSDNLDPGNIDAFLNDEDFELYGPSAGVDTQTAGQSQWQKAVLDHESNNFLDFIASAIEDRRTTATAITEPLGADESIEFGELLPTAQNSRTVAAQALLHVLTLGTKNLIRVMQREAFAAISLHVV